MAKAALENAVLTAILVTQLQAVTGKFHSLPLEGLEVKEMSSVMVVVIHTLWVQAVHIIDKVAEAGAAPLDIKIHLLQLLLVVAEQAATAAGLTKQAQLVQTGFVAYSGIIFQAIQMAVLQKKFSINAGKDF